MNNYWFLSLEASEIAMKLDEIIQKRKKLKLEYLDKPYAKETSTKIHEDWELDNLEWKYRNELKPYLRIKIEVRAVSN